MQLRRLSLVAAGIAAMLPGLGAMALASPAAAGSSRLAPRSGSSFAHAPAGLRAAVRRTLGTPALTGLSAFQQAKLLEPAAVAGDEFGYSVAINGSTAVVGAPHRAKQQGAAYVFVRSGTKWSFQAQLIAPNSTAGDQFGHSVALSGSIAVIGAYGHESSRGIAFVFVRSGTTWSFQAGLSASDGAAKDQFGYSVALYGTTAVVGAPQKSAATGAAYIFVQSGTTWLKQAELLGAAGDEFGYSVALNVSTAVVGAPGHNTNLGAAYVYVRSGTTWPGQAVLTAADGAHGDQFGHSVAISGSIAVVGAPFKNGSTGRAYLFGRSGTSWSLRAEPNPSDLATGNEFGWSVTISGAIAVVGAPGQKATSGAAYVFGESGTAWSQETKLTASDAASADFFAGSLAIYGSTVVAGASGKLSSTGAGYVFVLPSEQAELTGRDGVAGDYFGFSVAISGSIAVVGAPHVKSKTGAAYVFVRSGTTWSQQAKLTASDAAAGHQFGYSVAIDGTTAVVGAINAGGYGTAYVFVQSGTTWPQQQELIDVGGAPGDGFGNSVAVSGNTALVGAAYRFMGRGAVYTFARSGTTWSNTVTLTEPSAAMNDQFGFSVALSGSTAAIGASATGGRGAAYVFVYSGGTWSEQAKLTASDGASGDAFGRAVAIDGSTAVVGDPFQKSMTGEAYVFVRSGTVWSQTAKLIASDAAPSSQFGGAVAVFGSTALVGASNDHAGKGAVYIFGSPGWSEQAKLTAADGATGDQFGSAVAMDGTTAVVGALGHSSAKGAAYVLVGI